jgi:UDP-glucose 4-epimerase
MRVLVTGGTGYIGSTAVEILRTQGYEISILDDCSMGHADTVPAGVTFVQGSLLNTEDIAKALTGCDAVMHFAGKSLVGEPMVSQRACPFWKVLKQIQPILMVQQSSLSIT